VQLHDALAGAVERLTAADVGSPRLNAETLLMFTLDCDRAYLYAHPERELTAEEAARYEAALAQRARGMPSQYITGHQEFWGLDLLVSPAVLIPRPETEHVVETVLELAGANRQSKLRIVDVGTGSGCIALALASEFPKAEIVASDISRDALEVARTNAARLQFAERVSFRESDLLAAFPEGDLFDFVVSNPPYVGDDEADKVQRQVREFEPRVAVFAGAEGLDIYRRLIPQAQRVLKPGGWLVMEIGYSIEGKVRELLEDWEEVRTTNDLQGIPRVVAARRDRG
jgi:release factor glutamine methyltransferase